MSVLVTGAAGHIGGNLVRELIARSQGPVRALVYRDFRALEGLDVEIVRGDLLEPSSLAPAMEGVEVVYHLAARILLHGAHRSSEREAALTTNVRGTRNVVEAALRARVRRFVHFSSVHALSQRPLDQPLDESRPLADTVPSPPYEQSKARAEREVLAGVDRGLDAVILNPSAVVGPFDFKPSHTGELILDLVQGRIPALVRNGYSWVDVRDVVDAALAAAERGRTGERYLLPGRYLGLPEFSALVGSVSGARTPTLVVPMWLARVGAPFVTGYCRVRGRRPLFTRETLDVVAGNTRMRSEKAARDLGYEPRSTTETVSDTYRWFRRAGMV